MSIHSHSLFGGGRLNGYKFFTAVQNWRLVKPQAWLELPAVQVRSGPSTSTGDEWRVAHYPTEQLGGLEPITVEVINPNGGATMKTSTWHGPRGGLPGATEVGVGFHEGFSEDEDPNTPLTAPTPTYHDEVEKRDSE
ncbi:hypothetical protein EDB85DRAFT_1896161 [Lactarius pseudohatsudake]|nr:hypothetical protein EDB85DRAFT_1896161 [Lactarius pseudohatsudake]